MSGITHGQGDNKTPGARQELATLTTWQGMCGEVRDYLDFQDHSGQNEIAEMMGDPSFPDDAFLRLQELRRDTGFRLSLWSHFLRAFSMGFAEEDNRRKLLIIQETHKMLRVAIDVGDVAGEVEARFLLGLAYHDIGEFARSVEQLVCVLELGRVIGLGDKDRRSRHLIGIMNWNEQAARLQPLFERAMWA